MKRIMIQVSEVAAQSLAVLAARCTRANKRCEGFTSQAALNVSAMMAMLSEDAAMVISRPGRWEGSNMAQDTALTVTRCDR